MNGTKHLSVPVRRGEAAVALSAAVLLGLLFDELNAFERFTSFVATHEAWQLDELFLVLMFVGISALVLAFRRAADLTREMQHRADAEARALELARHDPLTGLPNRRVLRETLPDLIAEAARGGEELSVFGIDLDHFKPINDVHGHELGDAVLVRVAERIGRACPGALVARVGGDEFIVAFAHEPGTDAPARLAGQMIRSLSAAYRVGERRLELGATIGIARAPVNSSDAEALVRAADIAMYEAKGAGRGGYRFFEADMDARLRARAALEGELRQAIAAGEIEPHFQPVIGLAGGRVVGYEALARWNHPTRGLVPPDMFIPIAEDLGLIDELANQILRAGCIAARDWAPDTSLSVNISPVQLKDPWLAPRLLAILSSTGFTPQRLVVEVTENAVIDDIDQAAQVFRSLQESGIRVALDDFGKGYSSLSHLRQLRFDHLKIDSSFVQTMDADESMKIVQAVASLGKALGMPVTAEGVETASVAEALRALGCEQAQGYWFGRPVPASGIAKAAIRTAA